MKKYHKNLQVVKAISSHQARFFMMIPLAVYIASLLQEAKAEAKAQALTQTSIQDAAMLSVYPQAKVYAVPEVLDATATAESRAEVTVPETDALNLIIDDMAVVTPITVTPDNEASTHVAVNANNASGLDAVVNGYSLHTVADDKLYTVTTMPEFDEWDFDVINTITSWELPTTEGWEGSDIGVIGTSSDLGECWE